MTRWGQLLVCVFSAMVIATTGAVGAAAAPQLLSPAAQVVAAPVSAPQQAPARVGKAQAMTPALADCPPADPSLPPTPLLQHLPSRLDVAGQNAVPAAQHCATPRRSQPKQEILGIPGVRPYGAGITAQARTDASEEPVYPDATTGATITGAVRDTGADGLPGILVYACGNGCFSATTTDDGTYSISVPGNASYLLMFDDPSGAYAGGYYSTGGITLVYDAANIFSVGSDGVSGKDVTLPVAVHIAGTVRNASNDGLSNIFVYACVDQGFCGTTSTNGDGTYSLSVAPNADYTLQFSDATGTYASGYYAAGILTYTMSDATTISVGSGDVSGKDVTLPMAIHIMGTVRNRNLAGVPGIQVQACGTLCSTTVTTADGSYSVAVAPNDSYTLRFDDYADGDYVSGYYDAGGTVHFTTDYAAASLVEVVTGDVSGKDVTLPEAVHVSGTVRDVHGAGLSNINVFACAMGCFQTTTAGDGAYSVGVDPNQSYSLEFDDYADGEYAGGYWSPGGFTTTYSPLENAVVVEMSDVTGKDIVLPSAVHISGTVRNGGNAGVPGINVFACVDQGFCYYAPTQDDGTYSIGVAPERSYSLEFDDYSGTYSSGFYTATGPGHFTMYYSDAFVFYVASGDVSGKDVTLPAAVHIMGTVRNAAMAGLAGIDVMACGYWCNYVATAADGSYSVAVAPNESYTLQFFDYSGEYAGGYWSPGGFTLAYSSANAVDVGSSDVSGKDIVLPAAAHIMGTVRNAAGTGLSDVSIYACEDDGFCYYVSTPAGGTYSDAVAPGRSYTLELDDNSGNYGSGYYSTGGGGHFAYVIGAASAIGVTDDDVSIADVTLPFTGATYQAITPVRAVDTRYHVGLDTSLTANVPQTFTVAGHMGIPANATGVTGNVTVVNPTYSWAVYLGPVETATPATSTINFNAGEIKANGVTVALSGTGQLSATYMSFSGNTTDLVFDITGFFTPDMSGTTYHPITPVRAVDTRYDTGLTMKLSANVPQTFQVAGALGIPGNATAVTGNVTVVNPTYSWAVYLGPVETATPATSTINFNAGDIKANGLTVALSGAGQLSATYISFSGNTTDLVFDITGYFTPNMTGASYHPITPVRVVDTRYATGLPDKLSANVPQTFLVSGTPGIHYRATAVTGNLTVVLPTFSWAVYLGPVSTATPSTSNINFNAGDINANCLAVALGAMGTLSATYMSFDGNTTDLVFDVSGYFTP